MKTVSTAIGGAPVGHLTLRGTRCNVPPLPQPGGGDDDGRSGDCADAAARAVSTPVCITGVRGSDGHGGGVGQTRSTIEVAHFRYFVSERRGSLTPKSSGCQS